MPLLSAKIANFTTNTHDIATGIASDMTSLLKLFLQLLMGPYLERDRDLFENILALGDEPQLFLVELEAKTKTDEQQAYSLSRSGFLTLRYEDSRRILPLLRAPIQHAEAQLYQSDSDSLPDTAAEWDDDGEVLDEISVFQCVIGTRFVSLRKVVRAGAAQYWLNLSELLLATNISQSRRSALRKEYSNHAQIEGRASRTVYWILYSAGLPLIARLGLRQPLQNLFDRASGTE